MSVQEFFTFLASSAGATAALSFIAERYAPFQKLQSGTKSLYMLVGSLVIAGTAYVVLTYVPPETLAQITPAFQLAYGIVGTWIANQVAHKADPHTTKV